MSRPGLGVMLFSLGGLFWRQRLSLAEGLELVASLGPDQGIELIGAQSLPSYPAVSDSDVRAFRSAVDHTGVVPVSYCAYLERARSRGTVLSPLQALPLVEREIATARQLGFPMVRINSATPEVLRELALMSDRCRIDLVVEIGTEPRTDPAVAALIEELDRLACPGLGLVQDFSAFVATLPEPFLVSAVAEGTPPEAGQIIHDAWTDRLPVGYAVDRILALPGLSPTERELAVTTAHTAFVLFRPGDVAGLRDVLPHLRHVQAKFFAVDPAGGEPCIPYEQLISLLRDEGYRGRIHSEFEGFLWSDHLDAMDQIARQQVHLVQLWQNRLLPERAPLLRPPPK
jgi:hypothetical protein